MAPERSSSLIIWSGIMLGQATIALLMHYGLYQSVIRGADEDFLIGAAIIIAIQFPAIIYSFIRFGRKLTALIFTFVLISVWVALLRDIKDSNPSGNCLQPKISFWLEDYECP